jgi:hypothetical protein
MIKSWMREIELAIQARSGASRALFICVALAAIAALTAFTFLCIAGYEWFAIQFGSVFAALIMAARQRAREQAILERAARARAGPGLLDPKLLTLAVQVGRSVGWQRAVPVALMGFMAAQWLREYRGHRHGTK